MSATERVGILVELNGGEQALQLMERLDSAITRLNRNKKFKTLGGLNQAKQELQGYINQLKKAEEAQKNWEKAGYKGDHYKNIINETTQAISQMEREQELATQKTRTLGDAMKSTFNSVSTAVGHIGAQMQSVGNALTRLSTPLRMLMRGTVVAAGFKLLNVATQGLNDSFARYDTMKTYSKTLKAFGFSTKEADGAVKELEQSVLGLPTGLDEIVSVQKRFLASSQDINKSTKLAIAYNNSILASQSDARQQKTAQRLLTALVGGAEIASSSWDALQRAIPMVFTELAKQSKMGVADYVSALKTGKITTDEFMSSFIKLGSEGNIMRAANVIKITWGGLAANVSNAFKRMGTDILSSFDQIFTNYNGRTLLQNLLGFDAEGNKVGKGVRDIIDSISTSIQDWIKANPDVFFDFFNTLKSFDWNGLLRGFGQGIQELVKSFQDMLKLVNGEDTSLFAEGIRKLFGIFGLKEAEDFGRFMAKMPVIGRGLSILGGLIKGSRGLIAALVTAISIPSLAKGGGFVGFFTKMFGNATQVRQMTTTLNALPSLGTMLKGVAKSLMGALTVFGNVALIGGAGIIAFKSFKTMINEVVEMVDIFKGMSPSDFDTANNILAKMLTFFGVFTAIGAVVGNFGIGAGVLTIAGTAIVGTITTMLSGFAALDTWLIKKSMQNFKDATDSVISIKNNLNEIRNIEVPNTAINKVMKDIGEAVSSMQPTVTGEFGDRKLTVSESKRISKITSYIADAMGSLKKLKDAFGEARGFNGISIGTTENIKTLFRNIGDIYNTINTSLGYANGSGVTPRSAEKVTQILESTRKTFGNLVGSEGIVGQITKLSEELPKILGGGSKGTVYVLFGVKEGIKRLFDGIGEIYKSIQEDFSWLITDTSTMVTPSSTNKVGQITTNVRDMFALIIGKEGIINQIQSISKELPKILTTPRQGMVSSMANVKGLLIDFFDQVSKLFTNDVWEKTNLQQAMNEKGRYKAVIEAIQEMFGKIVGDDGLIAQFDELAQKLPTVTKAQGQGALAPLTLVKGYLKDLFNGISEIYTTMKENENLKDMGEFSSSMQSLKESMGNIALAVESIASIKNKLAGMQDKEGNFSIGTSIKSLIDSVSSSFNTEQIEGLTGQIDAFKSAIETAFNTITELGTEIIIDASVKLSSGFSESVSNVVIAISVANSRIKNAINGIKTDYGTKNIYVTLQPRVKKLGNIPSGAGYASTGGFIAGGGKVLYRAGGGGVFGNIFKPRGTDVVPSMLSIGEYVQRKKAVDYWGIDFMRKINNMDIRGVMSDLASRVSQGTSRSTIVNNTYNNNQKVVQNINTNSSDFAYRSASRFAGAF